MRYFWRKRPEPPALSAPSPPAVVVMPIQIAEPREWTPADRSVLEMFFKSDTGIKLRERIFYDIQTAGLVVAERSAFQQGLAAGMNRALGLLLSLAAPLPPQEGEEEG